MKEGLKMEKKLGVNGKIEPLEIEYVLSNSELADAIEKTTFYIKGCTPDSDQIIDFSEHLKDLLFVQKKRSENIRFYTHNTELNDNGRE